MALDRGVGTRVTFLLVRQVFLVAGIPIGLVGLLLLIKAGFDRLEARAALRRKAGHDRSRKGEWL